MSYKLSKNNNCNVYDNLLTKSFYFRVNNMSGKQSQPRITFDEWAEAHHSILEKMEFLTNGDVNSLQNQSNFIKKRKGMHTREVNKIMNLINTLEQLAKKITNDLDRQYLESQPTNLFTCYSVREQNFMVRELIYLENKRKKLRIKMTTYKLVQYNNKLQELYEVASLFSSDLIPTNTICRPLDSLFEIDDIKISDELLIKERRLTSRVNFLRITLASYKVPVWVGDFQSFLISVVKDSVTRSDPKISYFYPTEQEVEVSRALFTRPTKFQNSIDSIFKELEIGAPVEPLIQQLVHLTYEWMPKDLKSTEQQSACILILFRAGFNYVYEKYSQFFNLTKGELEFNQKVEKIAIRPLSDFTFPLSLMQKVPTSSEIRQVFRNDKNFFSASQFLAFAEYESNPIDALFNIHKCLIMIQKAALINRLGENSAKFEDVNSLLCFDDLFSLFFGTSLASDIASLSRLHNFIQEFIPKMSLSPSFEYSYSNLQALIVHILNL